MIDQSLASKLLIPLWQLFPKSDDTPDYQDLVTQTLAKACQNEAHAREAVARLLETCRFKPLPVEVLEAANVCASLNAEEPPREEWESARQPGDEAFSGLPDLLDDRLLQLLRVRAEKGHTFAERESAKKFLALRTRREPTDSILLEQKAAAK